MIAAWAASKHAQTHSPQPLLPAVAAKCFWDWWSHLNAPTRISATNDNHLIPGPPDGPINEETLRAPGKNGFLSVLYLMMLWREWIGKGDITDWEMALADVGWVTRRLIDCVYPLRSTATKR